MHLSEDQARNLYVHLRSWDEHYNQFFPGTVQARLHAATHAMVASYIENAACTGSLFSFLQYLDSLLKSVVKTCFSVCIMQPDLAKDLLSHTYTLKGIGYSHKEVRWQVLLWLGSSFSRLHTIQGPSSQIDNKIFQDLLGMVGEEAGNFSGADTRAFLRLKHMGIMDDSEEHQNIRIRLHDDLAFPYIKWEVTEWGLEEGETPAILSVRVPSQMVRTKTDQGLKGLISSLSASHRALLKNVLADRDLSNSAISAISKLESEE